jgi:subtilisin family serine protease
MRHKRALAVLSTCALLVAGAATVGQAAAAPPPAVPTYEPAPLPTSWPAVPVDQRLQPWLAGELQRAGDQLLRVMVSGQSTPAALAAVAAAGLQVQQTWKQVGVVVAVGGADAVREVVAQPGVTYVEGDQPLEYELDTAHRATRSDQALTAVTAADGTRLDGRGITIAVIDSGIDGTHPMFVRDGESKVVRNLENVCTTLNGPTDICFQQEPTNDTDTNSGGGHGTHVAGIAAGYEVTTPEAVALRGAAPEAKLVGLSVGAAIGLINANAAMNWVVDHQRRPCAASDEQDGEIDPDCPPIRATNHSYGPINTSGDDNSFSEGSATVRIQRTLIAQQVSPVWAAGNDGGDGSVALTNPPGMDPTPGVLMVASYNDGQTGSRDSALSGFSSRGKRGATDTYPDLSAPGDLITSACRPTLVICQGAPSYDEGNYQTISGTSMATPYVAGVVAQLVQADGTARSPGEIEELLENTAHQFTAGGGYEPDPLNPASTTSFDKGHGLVDVTAALATTRGLEVPAPLPAPGCPPDARFSDDEGDATNALGSQTPLPSDPALDIRLARVQDVATATATVQFSARVTDLTPPALYGQYFEFEFSAHGKRQHLIAQRSQAGAQSYTYGDYGGTSGTRRTLARVSGSFDDAADEVTISLPLDTAQPTLAAGDELAGLALTTRRIAGVIVPDADVASGGCLFTIGSQSSSADPSPSSSASPVEVVVVDPSGAPSASGSPTASASASAAASASPSPAGGSDGGSGGGGSGSASPPASSSASPTTAASATASASSSSTPAPGVFGAAAAQRGAFVALQASRRVLDSRTGTGTSTGRKAGEVVLDLSREVPAGTEAVALNVTVTNPTATGFVVVHPAGSTPPGTSNVNFRRGQTQANEVVVRVPEDRRVVLRVDSASAHVIADLLGHFTSEPASDAGQVAVLDTPVRVLDSRRTTRPRVSGEVPVDLAARVPAGATAVVLNVTLTGADRRGFAVAYPTGTSRPSTSNVNVEPGQTQANEVISRLGRDGRVSVFLDSTSASLIVDLVGYVAPDGDEVRRFVALDSPVRAADSRRGQGLSQSRASGDVALTLPDQIPADATAVVLNVTAVGASRPGFVTVFGTGRGRPQTSNVNFGAGTVQANEVLTPIGAGRRVTLHVGGAGAPATHLVVDVVGYLTSPRAQ